MGQTTYALEQSPFYEGQIADSRDAQIDGYRNDAAVEIPYGRAVIKSSNTDDLGIDVPGVDTVLLGVLVRGQNLEKTAADIGLPLLAIGNVMSRGRCVVKVENAVTPNDPVRVRIDSGGNGVGSFSTGAAVNDSLVLVPQARFMTRAGINGLAVLDLNLPPLTALT